MNITDELRELPSFGSMTIEGESYDPLREMVCVSRHDLLAIADRIDAEHEKAIASVMNDALYHANEEDMAELGWMRMPKDADGEIIHIGDVMAYTDNTKPMEVVAIVPPVIFLTEDGPRYADMCRHYHAPTVEDVLREFADIVRKERVELATISEDTIAEYAAKLRLAGDEK